MLHPWETTEDPNHPEHPDFEPSIDPKNFMRESKFNWNSYPIYVSAILAALVLVTLLKYVAITR